MKDELDKKRQLTIIYSRVVGWFTPISQFNKGKEQEYLDRKEYILKDI